MAPAPAAETEEQAQQRKAEFEQREREHEAEQQRRNEERAAEFERQQQEREAEEARRDELRKAREATFERIVANSPETFNAAQLRVLLRAIVNLDPYTFADDLAEDLAAENPENDNRSAEEVLLATIDATADEKLTGFALRLALSGHRAIPREGEPDFLSEAEAAFAQPKQKKSSTGKKKEPTPIRKATAKKPTNRKKLAA